MYKGVPCGFESNMDVLMAPDEPLLWVTPVNVATASSGATLAMPTSPSLEVRFWSRRMLEGFRSLWMTHGRDLCMKRSAVAICREGRLRLYSGRGERRSEGPQD